MNHRGIAIFLIIAFYSCGGKKEYGQVAGKLGYPSDYVIPAMNVYLRNIKTGNVLSCQTKVCDTAFEFKDVPVGIYVAYAYTVNKVQIDSKGNRLKGSGGYTYAVPCGLSVSCTNHSLIPIKIESGKPVKNIRIFDWYGEEVPEE